MTTVSICARLLAALLAASWLPTCRGAHQPDDQASLMPGAAATEPAALRPLLLLFESSQAGGCTGQCALSAMLELRAGGVVLVNDTSVLRDWTSLLLEAAQPAVSRGVRLRLSAACASPRCAVNPSATTLEWAEDGAGRNEWEYLGRATAAGGVVAPGGPQLASYRHKWRVFEVTEAPVPDPPAWRDEQRQDCSTACAVQEDAAGGAERPAGDEPPAGPGAECASLLPRVLLSLWTLLCPSLAVLLARARRAHNIT